MNPTQSPPQADDWCDTERYRSPTMAPLRNALAYTASTYDGTLPPRITAVRFLALIAIAFSV
jgi:hypothetical protein